MSESAKVNSNNVSAGKPKVGGAVFVAPAGTALPTSASEELDTAFKSLGYIGEEGLVNSNSPESDSKKAWGGDVVLNYSTGRPDKFNFNMIEIMNVDVLKTVYGADHVSGDLDTGIHVEATSEDLEESAWVFDMILKGGALKRVVVSSASITEMSDITYNDENYVGYAVTISATPDSKGKTHDEYIIKPSKEQKEEL